jgi:hypothetical protein
MEGRETASEGQRKAASYIENAFKNLGLLPGNKGSYQSSFPVYQDSLNRASIEVNGKSFQYFKDFTVGLGNTYTSTILAGEVVFVGYGISDSTRDDYKGINTKGKIVDTCRIATINCSIHKFTTRPARFNSLPCRKPLPKWCCCILQVQGFRVMAAPVAIKTPMHSRNHFPHTFGISDEVAEAIIE